MVHVDTLDRPWEREFERQGDVNLPAHIGVTPPDHSPPGDVDESRTVPWKTWACVAMGRGARGINQ